MEPTADMYNLRGLCYRKLNKGPEALADFNTAISLDPGNGIYYQNRSFYYFSAGDKASAMADIQKAESLGVKPDQAFMDALKK